MFCLLVISGAPGLIHGDIMLYLSLIHVHKSYNDTIMILWMSFLICIHAYNVDYVHVHACIIMLLVDASSEMNC